MNLQSIIIFVETLTFACLFGLPNNQALATVNSNGEQGASNSILQLLLDKRTRTASRGRARGRWGGSRGGRWHGRRDLFGDLDVGSVGERKEEEGADLTDLTEIVKSNREVGGGLADEDFAGFADATGDDYAWREEFLSGSEDEEEEDGEEEEEENNAAKKGDLEKEEKKRFLCPPLTRANRSRKQPGTAVQIKVANWAEVPAQVILIDSDGSFRNIGDPIEPGQSSTITTRPGRAYVVYSADSAAYRMFLNYKCIWFVNQDDSFGAITD